MDSRTIRDPLRGETGPLLLCKFAEGYMCRFDEVICCEVMEWQRTSLARNRNADRVGINCFRKTLYVKSFWGQFESKRKNQQKREEEK